VNAIAPAVARSAPLDELRALLGEANVVTDAADLAFYSTDVYRRADHDACVVLRPGDTAELAACVKLCTARGVAVIARGGGLSYTGGFLPVRAGSAIIDMQRLDAIVEIDETDMHVTVQCGATWRSLYEALRKRGLRTPYFGPMSGYASTIGGALSQGSVFLGSTRYGTTADSVLSLDVVTADGGLISTGSAGTDIRPSPFFRNYGPDLTGLFLHDSGALGFKATATLRLLHAPAHTGFAAFTFPDQAALLAAMSEIGRRGLASECFGADPYIWGMRLWDADMARDVRRVLGVLRSGGNRIAGAWNALRMALAGRRALDHGGYAMNVAVDGHSRGEVEAALADIRRIALKDGTAIEPSVARAVRGAPFLPPNDLLGPRGHRWAPSHGIAPHSRIAGVADGLRAFFAARAEMLARHGIEWGFVAFAVSTTAILLEPMLYWPDARHDYHERMIEPSYLAKLPRLPADPAAAAAVEKLRGELTRFWMEQGCAHLQIGKTYRYAESRQPAVLRLLTDLKAAVDPHGLVNPGALGLA
jgi:FAD/FMN-containing dehydrogenase